jgi:conjugative relaxase-like TrwC/TraI family protein
MITPKPIRSASHGASYFTRQEHSDYYAADESCRAYFTGKGAEYLGLSGQEVTHDKFKRLLDGQVADQQLGTFRNGVLERRCGLDFCASPPKSVSTALLVGKDVRILTVMEDAVEAVVRYSEENLVSTRRHTRTPEGHDHYDHIATGNAVAAVFFHETSRTLCPQAHHHIVFPSMTRDSNGQWRSMESHPFYVCQKDAGLLYRQVLAAGLVSLGYGLTPVGEDSFEISGIPADLLKAFSKRSMGIEEKLRERGLTRKTAASSLKEDIAHASRDRKVRVDREELQERWASVAKEHEFDATAFVQSAVEQSGDPEWRLRQACRHRDLLESQVKLVIKILSERLAVFSRQALQERLTSIAVGYGLSASHIDEGIRWAIDEGLLIPSKTTKHFSRPSRQWEAVDGFTTPDNIVWEKRLLETLRNTRASLSSVFSENAVEKIIQFADERSLGEGFSGWSEIRKSCLRDILQSTSAISSLVGYAGSAKTSSLVRSMAMAFEEKGYEVVGMAQSASACESLREGANVKRVETVAGFLVHQKSVSHAHEDKGPQLWIVDEASLLGTREMAQLLELANRKSARVLLAGDTQQLASVGAGSAFRQLQEHGLPTYHIDEIVRQENDFLLDSVFSAIEGDAEKALAQIQAGGGQIVENAGSANARVADIVRQYMSLTREERSNTLIVDPSREGRDALNRAIRAALRVANDVGSDEVMLPKLTATGSTKAELKTAASYRPGDVVRFTRGYVANSIAKNSYWRVVNVQIGLGIIELEGDSGRRITWNPAVRGGRVQAYRSSEATLSVGDQIRWTLNDRSMGVVNGMRGRVVAVGLAQNNATVELTSGTRISLDLSDRRSHHWDYDYVSTVYSAQGRTADRIIFHAESYRHNLMSQKAFYVAISRAKQVVTIVTDNQQQLVERFRENSGEKSNALEREIDPEFAHSLELER